MSIAAHRFNNDLRYRAEDHEAQTQLTPVYVLDPIVAALGGLGLDPCTTPLNPCAADRFYTPPQDGAELPWDAETIYCNPPYGKARERWVRRCMEAAAAGSKVVLLIPAHTDTRIFQSALTTADSLVLIRGRVKFGVLRPNRRQQAASHPSALIGWNVDLSPCAALGHVQQMKPSTGLASPAAVPVTDEPPKHEHKFSLDISTSWVNDESVDYACLTAGCRWVWRDSVHGAGWVEPPKEAQ